MVREVSLTFSMATRCLLLALLASGFLSASAQAQQTPAASPFRAALNAAGLRTDPAPMPDFVTRTRPPADRLHYIPMGGARPEPPDKPLTPDQIRAEEVDLAGLRSRDDRLGGRKPVVVVARSAAGKPPPAKKKPVKTCRLTCTIGKPGSTGKPGSSSIGQPSSMR